MQRDRTHAETTSPQNFSKQLMDKGGSASEEMNDIRHQLCANKSLASYHVGDIDFPSSLLHDGSS